MRRLLIPRSLLLRPVNLLRCPVQCHLLCQVPDQANRWPQVMSQRRCPVANHRICPPQYRVHRRPWRQVLIQALCRQVLPAHPRRYCLLVSHLPTPLVSLLVNRPVLHHWIQVPSHRANQVLSHLVDRAQSHPLSPHLSPVHCLHQAPLMYPVDHLRMSRVWIRLAIPPAVQREDPRLHHHQHLACNPPAHRPANHLPSQATTLRARHRVNQVTHRAICRVLSLRRHRA